MGFPGSCRFGERQDDFSTVRRTRIDFNPPPIRRARDTAPGLTKLVQPVTNPRLDDILIDLNGAAVAVNLMRSSKTNPGVSCIVG